jgi:hypothetical protein
MYSKDLTAGQWLDALVMRFALQTALENTQDVSRAKQNFDALIVRRARSDQEITASYFSRKKVQRVPLGVMELTARDAAHIAAMLGCSKRGRQLVTELAAITANHDSLGVLPAFDLDLWGRLRDVRFSDNLVANAIWPAAECDNVERLRKVTRRKIGEVLGAWAPLGRLWRQLELEASLDRAVKQGSAESPKHYGRVIPSSRPRRAPNSGSGGHQPTKLQRPTSTRTLASANESMRCADSAISSRVNISDSVLRYMRCGRAVSPLIDRSHQRLVNRC